MATLVITSMVITENDVDGHLGFTTFYSLALTWPQLEAGNSLCAS